MIGCDCEVCHSPDPRDQRLRSSIYVETPECAWVVDTGTDFRTQALRENIRTWMRSFSPIRIPITSWGSTIFGVFRTSSARCRSTPPRETMRDLERVFNSPSSCNPIPWYLVPEPHIVDGPFELGRDVAHAVAGAARRVDRERISVFARERETGRLPERLQRCAGCDCRADRWSEGPDHRRACGTDRIRRI